MEYDPYEYQGYQDPYAQDPYGYGGYSEYDGYGYDAYEQDPGPPPPPDKDWQDPGLQNRAYLQKIQKGVVNKEYSGLNELNMYLVEVLVNGFEINNDIAESDNFKDKTIDDFFTSVKILHYPFLEVSNLSMIGRKLRSERVPSFTDLFQTVYTGAGPHDSSFPEVESLYKYEQWDAVSQSKSTLKFSVKEKLSAAKEKESRTQEHELETKTFTVGMGKSVLFTMTGLSMLQSIMQHEIRVRLSERILVDDVTESDAASRGSGAPGSRRNSAQGSKGTQRNDYVVPRKKRMGHVGSVEGPPLGTAAVRLPGLYHSAVLEAARPEASPPSRTGDASADGHHLLVDGEGMEIGTVGLSILMTCMGKAVVNCVRETKDERYEFEHTLFLNNKKLNPVYTPTIPPVDPRLAKLVLEMGVLSPNFKTSSEVLEHGFDNDLIEVSDQDKRRLRQGDCDWSRIVRRVQTSSILTDSLLVDDISALKREQDLRIGWIDLRRVSRELRDDEQSQADKPKEKSLYERLEEMRMSLRELDIVDKESKTDEEEVLVGAKDTLITNRSISHNSRE